MRQSFSFRQLYCFLFAMMFVFCGCQTAGPDSIKYGMRNYVTVLNDSANEELIQNLVRLRYGDTVSFMEVSSITSSLTVSAGIGGEVGGSFMVNSPGMPGEVNPNYAHRSNGLTMLGNGSLGYSESPTITYTPLQGSSFIRQMMTPMELESMMFLSLCGWDSEKILRLTLNSINDMRNANCTPGSASQKIADYQKFVETIKAFRAADETGLIDVDFVVVRPTEKTHRCALVVNFRNPGDAKSLELKKALGIDPASKDFQIDYGTANSQANTVSVLTRPMASILNFVAYGVQPPAEHVSQGLIAQIKKCDGSPLNTTELVGDMIKIYSSKSMPEKAYLMTHYRNYWFYILDTDHASKSTFALVRELLKLQAGETASSPALVLPVK